MSLADKGNSVDVKALDFSKHVTWYPHDILITKSRKI